MIWKLEVLCSVSAKIWIRVLKYSHQILTVWKQLLVIMMMMILIVRLMDYIQHYLQYN